MRYFLLFLISILSLFLTACPVNTNNTLPNKYEVYKTELNGIFLYKDKKDQFVLSIRPKYKKGTNYYIFKDHTNDDVNELHLYKVRNKYYAILKSKDVFNVLEVVIRKNNLKVRFMEDSYFTHTQKYISNFVLKKNSSELYQFLYNHGNDKGLFSEYLTLKRLD